jgi:hypothetical protein
VRFSCELARKELGWTPIERSEELLDKAVHIHVR